MLLNEEKKYKLQLNLNNLGIWKRLLLGCIEYGDVAILEYILNYKEKSGKLNINVTNYDIDETVLYEACKKLKNTKNQDSDLNLQIVILLMRFGANPNEQFKIIKRLIESSIANKLEILKVITNESKIYKYSFDWNKFFSENASDDVLYMCGKHKEYDCLRYLLSIDKNMNLNTKLNVNYVDDKDSNQTVLNLCIENNEWDCFDEIVSHFGNEIKWEYTFYCLAYKIDLKI